MAWSYKHKFKIWERSDQWLLRYSNFAILGSLPFEIIFHLRSSSCEIFEYEKSLAWLYRPKFKIWERSDQWFLRYSNTAILGILPFKVIFHFSSSS